MKKVLVFNFYKGIVARGIVVQMDNFCYSLDKNNIPYEVISCPKFLRSFPVLGLIFLLFEQFIVPIKGVKFDVVVYPFNSVSIFAPLHRGSLLVVHDFIQNRKKFPGFYKAIAWVVRITQCWYSLWHGNVAFITEAVKRQSEILGCFQNSHKYILPNTFFLFSKKAEKYSNNKSAVVSEPFILFCTGKVPTKGLSRALKLYSTVPKELRLPVKVLGLAGDVSFFRTFNAFDIEYEILPMISDEELIAKYSTASFIWVHSNQEGFGRNVTEGLICHRKVLASDIKPFREQANRNVYLYNNSEIGSFLSTYEKCLRSDYILEDDAINSDAVFNESMKLILNANQYI